MIITNIADGQVASNKAIKFTFREIAYTIEDAKGTKIEGAVPSESYLDVDVSKMQSPYKVSLGYVNNSYHAQPVTVDDDDAMVFFWMYFPAPPGGPVSMVFQQS